MTDKTTTSLVSLDVDGSLRIGAGGQPQSVLATEIPADKRHLVKDVS